MKFKAGRYIVKMTNHGIHEVFMFVRLWQERDKWYYKADDGIKDEVTEDIRDNVLQDLFMHKEFRPSDKPEFSKVVVTVEATEKSGSTHCWQRTNGEALEKLLKAFPALVDRYWADKYRKEKIHSYLKERHHKPKGRY